MPQRLRQLSQDWANLAVRGFDKSAQAEIDKNNRDRDNLNAIGNTIASGIVRKKGRDRQDKLLADANTREDAIRRERYGREDARNTIEDARYTDERQFRRNATNLQYLSTKWDDLNERARIAQTPDEVAAISQELQSIKQQKDSLMQLQMGIAQKNAPPVAPVGAGPIESQPLGTASANDVARAGGMDAIAKSNERFALRGSNPSDSKPYDAKATAAAHARFDAPAAPPAAATGEAPAAVAPPPMLPEEREADKAARMAAALNTRKEQLESAGHKSIADGGRHKDGVRGNQMIVDGKRMLDEAIKIGQQAADTALTAQEWGRKAGEAKAKEATRIANRQAVTDLSVIVKRTGDPFVIGTFIGAVRDGASPEAIQTLVLGAMKKKDAERALAAKQLTPAQEEAQAARKGTLSGIEGRARNAADPRGDDTDAKVLKSARNKWANAIKYESTYPGTLDALSEQMDDAELEAGANDPTLGPKATAWFKAALSERMGMSVGLGVSGTGAGSTPAPRAVDEPLVDAKPSAARSAASAELKALPPEQQTPEVWAAIKKKHGL